MPQEDFERLRSLGLSEWPFFGDIAKHSYESFKRQFVDRRRCLRAFKKSLRAAIPVGENILIVGSVGIGKSNLVKIILHDGSDTLLPELNAFPGTVPVTSYTVDASTPGKVENLTLDRRRFELAVFGVVRDFLKQAGVPFDQDDDLEMQYARAIALMHGPLPSARKLVLFVDDIDHLHETAQQQAVASLYYLLESPNCSVILTVRPPAKENVKYHPDNRIGKQFPPQYFVAMEPLPVNLMVGRRLAVKVSSHKAADPQADARTKDEEWQLFSSDTEALIENLTNHDNRDVLRVSECLLTRFHESWQNNARRVRLSQDDVVKALHEEGMIVNLYSRLVPRSDAPIRLNILEALEECHGRTGAEFWALLKDRCKKETVNEVLGELYELNLVDEYFHVGYETRLDEALEQYELTEKGRFYTYVLAADSQYITLCGGSRKGSLWESRQYRGYVARSVVVSCLVENINENGWHNVEKIHHRLAQLHPEVSYRQFRNILKSEALYESLDGDNAKFDVRRLHTLARTLGIWGSAILHTEVPEEDYGEKDGNEEE